MKPWETSCTWTVEIVCSVIYCLDGSLFKPGEMRNRRKWAIYSRTFSVGPPAYQNFQKSHPTRHWDGKGTVPFTLVFPSQHAGTYRKTRWYLTFMWTEINQASSLLKVTRWPFARYYRLGGFSVPLSKKTWSGTGNSSEVSFAKSW